jgi:hypothetical protein
MEFRKGCTTVGQGASAKDEGGRMKDEISGAVLSSFFFP